MAINSASLAVIQKYFGNLGLPEKSVNEGIFSTFSAHSEYGVYRMVVSREVERKLL